MVTGGNNERHDKECLEKECKCSIFICGKSPRQCLHLQTGFLIKNDNPNRNRNSYVLYKGII